MIPGRAELPTAKESGFENRKINPTKLEEAMTNSEIFKDAWPEFRQSKYYLELLNSQEISLTDLPAIGSMTGGFLRFFMREQSKTLLPNVFPDNVELNDYPLLILRRPNSLKVMVSAWREYNKPKSELV